MGFEALRAPTPPMAVVSVRWTRSKLVCRVTLRAALAAEAGLSADDCVAVMVGTGDDAGKVRIADSAETLFALKAGRSGSLSVSFPAKALGIDGEQVASEAEARLAAPGTVEVDLPFADRPSANIESGEGEEELATPNAFSLDIGFNARYLAAMLPAIGTDRVRVRLADPGSAGIFEGVGRPNATFVIMPLRF